MTPRQNAPTHRGPEPRGFGEHSRGLSGEYAHEQGWGLELDERTKVAPGPKGSNDYSYGARDFGDEALHVSAEDESAARKGVSDAKSKA